MLNLLRALQRFQPGGLLEPATDGKRGMVTTLPSRSTAPVFRSLRIGELAIGRVCGGRPHPPAGGSHLFGPEKMIFKELRCLHLPTSTPSQLAAEGCQAGRKAPGLRPLPPSVTRTDRPEAQET
jgi:hypothetical protein